MNTTCIRRTSENTNQSDPVFDLIEGETTTEIGNNRLLVALEASWEIEKLSSTLRDVIVRDDTGNFLLTRGITARIEDLSKAIMHALSDQVNTTADICRIVTRELPTQEI